MTRSALLLGAVLAVLAVSSVGGAPRPAGAAVRSCGSSPTRAVRLFYDRLDRAQYAAAWRCLSTESRRVLGGYTRFRRDQEPIRTVELLAEAVRRSTRSSTTVSFTLRTCKVSRPPTVQRITGSWVVRRSGSSWRLGSPDVRRTSQSQVSSC